MRISEFPLVFSEIIGLSHFSDVVKQRAGSAHDRVRTNRYGGVLGQISYHQTVMVSSGRIYLHLPEQRVIEIGQLEQGCVGGNLETILNQRHCAQDQSSRKYANHK